MRIFLTAFVFFAVISVAQAADIRLQWPVACSLGENCWMMNYVDIDPATDKIKDAQCSWRTYEGHNGTDIALADIAAMEKGYAVLAVADGVVERLRDSEPDKLKATAEDVAAAKASKRECGNGILIKHANGLKSQYCHLKMSSILVKQGAQVTAGQPLAEIGLSGVTQHPHLHLSLMDEQNRPLDPFGGKLVEGGCEAERTGMWVKEIPYMAADIFSVGLADAPPKYDDAIAGRINPPVVGGEKLFMWLTAFGLQKGDNITMQLSDPDGKITIQRRIVQDENKARQFYFAGKTTPPKVGIYKLQARVERDGATISEKTSDVTIKAEDTVL